MDSRRLGTVMRESVPHPTGASFYLLEEGESKADHDKEQAEGALEVLRRNLGGKPGAEVTAEDGQWDDGKGGAPLDVALVEMFERADQGGGDDHD